MAMGAPSAPTCLALLLAFLFLLTVPWGVDCGAATSAGHGYNVVSVVRSANVLSARLELIGETAVLGPDIQRLSLTASASRRTATVLRCCHHQDLHAHILHQQRFHHGLCAHSVRQLQRKRGWVVDGSMVNLGL